MTVPPGHVAGRNNVERIKIADKPVLARDSNRVIANPSELRMRNGEFLAARQSLLDFPDVHSRNLLQAASRVKSSPSRVKSQLVRRAESP